MKKVVLVLALVLVVSMSAFAANSWIGVTAGPGLSVYSHNIFEAEKASTAVLYELNFSIQGAHYFGDTFGIGYGIDTRAVMGGDTGLDLPDFGTGTSMYGSYYPFAPVPGNFYLSFMYRKPFSEKFSLEVGAGPYMTWGGESRSYELYDQYVYFEATTTTFGIHADVAAKYDIFKHLAVRGGLKTSFTLYGSYKQSSNGSSMSTSMHLFGATFYPYVTLAFAY